MKTSCNGEIWKEEVTFISVQDKRFLCILVESRGQCTTASSQRIPVTTENNQSEIWSGL